MKIARNPTLKLAAIALAIAVLIAAGFGHGAAQGKTPVILIPGLTGSELINEKTREKVWFRTRRSKFDDISLPISPNLAANRDSLVAGDIIRSVKAGILPRTDVYGGLISYLSAAGGYREAKWEAPPRRGYEDTIYVFPYDWRRDNVENARLLVRKIEALKRRLNRPNLKFNVIAHSMGGLIARYAAMYGDADLPAAGTPPAPSWAGARNFDKLILIATPSEGTVLALKNLVNGVSLLGVGINLPFVRNLSKFDVFTVPSGFQLLPSPGTLKVFDENLKPIDLDIYDPATWKRYGWSVMEEKDFVKEFTTLEQQNAELYFSVVLDRAKRFHAALDAVPPAFTGVPVNIVGADCRETLDGMVLYQKRDGKWDTVFKADSFETPAGRKVSSEELKKVLYSTGDGIVTNRSLLAATVSRLAGIDSILFPAANISICEAHDSLPGNPDTQARIMTILTGRK